MTDRASSSAAAAVACVRSGDTVVAPLMPGGPQQLLAALCARLGELKNITLVCGDLSGRHVYLDSIPEGQAGELKMILLAGLVPKRSDIAIDWAPLPLCDVAYAWSSGAWRADVCLVAVTPVDDEGQHRIAPTLAWLAEPVRQCRDVIAEVSERLPRMKGDNGITPARLAAFIHTEAAPVEQPLRPIDDLSMAVGRKVATLIHDGDCLQLGIGGMVEALLLELHHHRDLGLHTGTMADGTMRLVESGVMTNRYNPHAHGRFHTMSARGSAALYQYVDGNDRFRLRSPGFIGDPKIIAALPGFIAINSALAVDLTGQVNAESILGKLRTSGGGQMDYARAARLTPRGRCVIMLASTGGRDAGTRIVPRHAAGDLITTHRADVDYVVTEHGIADLRLTTLTQRASRLIAIAHPAHRDMLAEAAWKLR